MHSLLIICGFYDLCYSQGQDLAWSWLIAGTPSIPWATSASHKWVRYVESGYPLLHTNKYFKFTQKVEIGYFKCQINAFWEIKHSFSQSTLIKYNKYTKCWFILQACSFLNIFKNFLTRFSLVKSLCHHLFKIHLYHTNYTTNPLTYLVAYLSRFTDTKL